MNTVDLTGIGNKMQGRRHAGKILFPSLLLYHNRPSVRRRIEEEDKTRSEPMDKLVTSVDLTNNRDNVPDTCQTNYKRFPNTAGGDIVRALRPTDRGTTNPQCSDEKDQNPLLLHSSHYITPPGPFNPETSHAALPGENGKV